MFHGQVLVFRNFPPKHFLLILSNVSQIVQNLRSQSYLFSSLIKRTNYAFSNDVKFLKFAMLTCSN